MLKTPVLFGLPLARRSNRRLVVTVSYAAFALMTVATVLMFPELYGLGWILAISWNLLLWEFLRRLVEGKILPEWRAGEVIGLGLGRTQRGQDSPDEREVAVRNAACFQAYRALVVYSLA